jgi:signal transduction histidine kinase
MSSPGNIVRSSVFRMGLVYVVLFGTSVLLLLAFIYWSTAGYMLRQADATIEAEITGLAEVYRSTGLLGLTRTIRERLSRTPAGPSVYLLVDVNNVPVIGNLDRWPDVEPDEDGWLDFRLGTQGSSEREDAHWGRARSFRLQGGYYLLVGRDIHELEAIQALIRRTVAWGLAIMSLLALVGGGLLSRSMGRRIGDINEAIAEIMSGDLARRIPAGESGDDFDRLIDNLNRMLDRIESLMEGVRQVSDNIAHDLRTPLARLRNRLETLGQMQHQTGAVIETTPDGGSKLPECSSPHASDPAPDDWRTVVEEALADADGMLAAFNALLRIARIESGARRAEFTDFDLTAVAEDVVALYEPLAEEKRQEIEVDLEVGVTVRGDRDLLFQALANLLDNATKYTPPGGRLAVRLWSTESQVQVMIADAGPGIPAASREKVFQRFYRLDDSRGSAGSGLGLSLVRAVVQLHGGSISLEDNAPGLRVRVSLPRRDS